MAGDWIKMRGALIQSPKLIALARFLHRNSEFRDWLIPGASGQVNGQSISDDALRCVTCALLLRVWSAAREFGKIDGDHLFLPHISVPDLDLMASAPCVGKAMVAVGWAQVKDGDHGGVILPNFRQHNAPMTPAEKQSAYRNRKNESSSECVTARYQSTVTKRSPEKRREENIESPNGDSKPPLPPDGGKQGGSIKLPESLRTEEFKTAWMDWVKHRKEIKKPLKPTQAEKLIAKLSKWGPERSIRAINFTIEKGWQGLREPDNDDERRTGLTRPSSSGGRTPNLLEREQQRESQQLEILQRFAEGSDGTDRGDTLQPLRLCDSDGVSDGHEANG